MTKELDTRGERTGQAKPIDMPTTKPGIKRDTSVELLDGVCDVDDFAAELAFLEEPVDVLVHESTDNSAAPIVEVFHNGTPQRFIRGQVQTVKRKYLEVLARAKRTGYSQSVYRDQVSGEAIQRMNPHTALQFPFSVMNDTNPRGPAWVKKILAEA